MRTELLRLKGAVYDPNTDLHAAAATMEAVRALFHRSRTVGLLHVEIDPLARVETVYGWQVLDRILKAVSAELRWLRETHLPQETVISQRGIYGDRFLVFIPLTRNDRGSQAGLVPDSSRILNEQLARLFAGSDFRAMA